MPIQLDDIASIAASAAKKSLNPKFFSKSLTGSGKTGGLLNENVRPARYLSGAGRYSLPKDTLDRKSKSTGNNATTYTIPLAPLTRGSLLSNLSSGLTLPVPHSSERMDLAASLTKITSGVYLDLTPQSILLYEDGNGDKIVRELNILYRMEVFVLAQGSTADRATLVSSAPYYNAGQHDYVMVDWSFAPLDDVEELIANATAPISPSGRGIHVDIDELATWMSEYDVHDRICQLAEVWADQGIADVITDHITELFANGTPTKDPLNQLVAQLRYLETYTVSLDAYRQIHAVLNGVCPPDVATTLSKQNLNLLMSHTLEHLSTIKPQLPSPPQKNPNAAPGTIIQKFSTQQLKAVETDEPLCLVQAGAGTGKSTVIEGRISHLDTHGIDLSKIMVLSFTNAAADNITDRIGRKMPGKGPIKSMTIARMIHDIYSLNYPLHELSSMDTILNSLDIFYPSDNMAMSFRKHLMDVDKSVPGATTALNAFIERYFDQIISILNTIKQTCLELEIIIAYQQIDHMVEPPGMSTEYLIIDEVQDNSIFEFIYTLKYVAKHHTNLFIVGDASQTLYEFRASNPRALNALESSGVFETYQLTTNYRSNQEILDFANVHLADIEANQAAQLRLQANSLQMPTADSFQEKVRLNYIHTPRKSEFRDNYPAYLRNSVKPYIDECLARGEQVAFLMFTRDTVKTTEETLAQLYPGRHIANMVSERSYSTTVFSQFIKLFWEDVKQVPDVSTASFAVTKGIDDNLDKLTNNTKNPKVRHAVMGTVADWWAKNADTINGWAALENAGQMTREVFFDSLRQNILDYEIAHNAIKQSLMNQKNRERKEKNLQAKADLVVSTIHGAKGLEFDNVVVLHAYDSQLSEDKKRMYYVAFTRAMKSEYILSYGTLKKPRIESDFDLMVAALHKREKIELLRAQGYQVDTLSEDDVEAALANLEQQQQDADNQSDEPAGDDDAAETSSDGGGDVAPVDDSAFSVTTD